MNLPRPIGAIESLAKLIGEEAAFRLAEEHGGTRVYVPHKAAGSQLAQLIGDEAAASLSREWAGIQIKIPVARHWRVVAYRQFGYTYDAIAKRLGIDISTVHGILQKEEMTVNQLDLFDLR